MELEGTLKQFPLSELLSIMVSSVVTGALAVRGEGENGQVFSRGGRLIHATLGDMRGVAALERMVELPEAQFRFVSGVKASDQSLWGDPWLTMGMVLRHERLVQQIRPFVPGLNWLPVLRPEGAKNGVRLPADAWPLVVATDGQHSIAEIAAQLDYDRNTTALAYAWLAKHSLISFAAPRRQVVIRSLPSLGYRLQETGYRL